MHLASLPPLPGIFNPEIQVSLLKICASGSTQQTNSSGDKGHLCRTPQFTATVLDKRPFTRILLLTSVYRSPTRAKKPSGNPIFRST
uniref:Uncharacterized protein n=1 Tax=Anguilla anguilla TaxID=7936 RepID=A0A0E9TRT7_ANGAN